jgi:hypothetical protein
MDGRDKHGHDGLGCGAQQDRHGFDEAGLVSNVGPFVGGHVGDW